MYISTTERRAVLRLLANCWWHLMFLSSFLQVISLPRSMHVAGSGNDKVNFGGAISNTSENLYIQVASSLQLPIPIHSSSIK